jgi:hypothetical protein
MKNLLYKTLELSTINEQLKKAIKFKNYEKINRTLGNLFELEEEFGKNKTSKKLYHFLFEKGEDSSKLLLDSFKYDFKHLLKLFIIHNSSFKEIKKDFDIDGIVNYIKNKENISIILHENNINLEEVDSYKKDKKVDNKSSIPKNIKNNRLKS